MMGVAQGTGTFSGTTGSDNLRESSVTSGGSGASNVGGFILDHASTADLQQISIGVTVSGNPGVIQIGMELTATADGANNANIVEATQAFWSNGDSEIGGGGVPCALIFRNIMVAGNLIAWAGQWSNQTDDPNG